TRAGIAAMDSPYFELQNQEGLREETRKSRAMGFVGRVAVHPRQVADINAGYAPEPKAVERARKIVRATEEHGGEIVVVDGDMIGPPMVSAARKLLALEQKILEKDGSDPCIQEGRRGAVAGVARPLFRRRGGRRRGGAPAGADDHGGGQHLAVAALAESPSAAHRFGLRREDRIRPPAGVEPGDAVDRHRDERAEHERQGARQPGVGPDPPARADLRRRYGLCRDQIPPQAPLEVAPEPGAGGLRDPRSQGGRHGLPDLPADLPAADARPWGGRRCRLLARPAQTPPRAR